MKKRIGFMGLGIMGRAMAANLLKAGFPVTVYNRDKQKTLPLADMGAIAADSPRQLADNCDVAILVVGRTRLANKPSTPAHDLGWLGEDVEDLRLLNGKDFSQAFLGS
ncbi:6-phosphogluconate dehydrogenase-like protein [Desulfocurvibacter africanus PCS]|uniref:6-phosphogluconate dehydrogenase-like protein n=1 Tax=Desulfocurvibacter africanus PCS TaxID=1262666 RepID=M5PUP5_DESAF|nr:NAD(P)-binding domain-containing protein [Desulfocurvibacter africanus]EMG37730.1 6-phosphogluconate dehydrogenase-like protein [Desulfocurvibacter africanus PCS]